MEKVNIKAFLEKNGDVKGEIRRFQLTPKDGNDLYATLVFKVSEVFGLPDNFKLYWQGEEFYPLS